MPWRERKKENEFSFDKFFTDIVEREEIQEKKYEMYLLCGATLAKILMKATRHEWHNDLKVSFFCQVIEIDGVLTPDAVPNEEIFYQEPPTEDKTWKVFMGALQNCSIMSNPVRVSDLYVEGHLRAASLRRRIQERRASC